MQNLHGLHLLANVKSMREVDNIGCAKSIGFGYSYCNACQFLVRAPSHHCCAQSIAIASSDSRFTIATLSAELLLSTSRPDLSARRPNYRARSQGWRSLACTCFAAPATMVTTRTSSSRLPCSRGGSGARTMIVEHK